MTSLKRNLSIGFVFVSILGTVWHFIYQWTGEFHIIGFIAPINESTFEHMKLVCFPAIFYMPLSFYYLKNSYPDLIKSYAYGIVAGTLFIPVFFYTYSGILGYHITLIDIASFYLATLTTFVITYRLVKKNIQNSFGIYLLLVLILIFVIFTYQPPDLGLFKQP